MKNKKTYLNKLCFIILNVSTPQSSLIITPLIVTAVLTSSIKIDQILHNIDLTLVQLLSYLLR